MPAPPAASLANASSGDLSSLHQQQQEEGNNEAHGALMAPRDSAAISAEATLTVRTQSGGELPLRACTLLH